ncbi:hypothetical protein BDZ88DRAFT_423853 [Geranomyces variabilis]|nr:hypothetical protein BDZ88DRAFT_423853 [Geranomyces variabilis]KAJ3136223.1 hypothetical protein HDU90_003273 [Geranomyces variabilis]
MDVLAVLICFYMALAKHNRVEKQSQAIKEINFAHDPQAETAKTYAVDVVGVFGTKNEEICYLEQSGGPAFEGFRAHAKDDSIKVTNGISAIKDRVRNFLDVPAELATKVKSYALQVNGR